MGQPSALLGAFYAQKKLGIPAIGRKVSMSGTFMDLHVPPARCFAVGVVDADVSYPGIQASGGKWCHP